MDFISAFSRSASSGSIMPNANIVQALPSIGLCVLFGETILNSIATEGVNVIERVSVKKRVIKRARHGLFLQGKLGVEIGGSIDCFQFYTRNTLIYSEKSCLPKAKPSKINILDSRLRGNDDFFSVSLALGVLLLLLMRKITTNAVDWVLC